MTIDLALPRASVTPSTEGAANAAYAPYTRIPDTVLLDPRLTPGQLRIYAVIARRADREKATAFPSYATIARDAHVSRTSAINGVKALVTFGYLAKKAQESGQGDPTSNLYTISGEGSQIFVLPRPNVASSTPQAVQKLDHRSAEFVPQVVQPLDHGSAKFAPELDSVNKKKSNKIQENGRTRAQARETASTPAAAAPELQKLLNDFQENIGTLTGMAQEVICQLAEKHGSEWVRDAIQEAVIYEKRSLAYVRRVLEAWRRNGRIADQKETASSSREWMWSDYPSNVQPAEGDAGLRLFELDEDMNPPEPDLSDPAVAAWESICEHLPHMSQLTRWVIPRSLIDNVLTVTVSNERYYSVLTKGQSISVNVATRAALGDGAAIHVELVKEEAIDTKANIDGLTSEGRIGDFESSDMAIEGEFVWPPLDLNSDLPLESDMTDPAIRAWEAISREVPQLGRFRQLVTPVSLTDNILTVTVPDSRTYNALTWGLSSFMASTTRKVLGNGDALKVELAGESEGSVN